MTDRDYARTSIVAVLAIVLASFSRADEQAKSEKGEDSIRGTEAGQERADNGLKMKLVWCPKGFVTMEQVEQVVVAVPEPDEADDAVPQPIKAVTREKVTPVKVFLTRGYWLGKYEVTQAEWKQIMETEPWKGEGNSKEGDTFPAIYINWTDAMAFCHRLTEHEQNGGRLPAGWEYMLPTEAQWERACRAGTDTKYCFGDDASKLDGYAWYIGNTEAYEFPYAHRIGQKKPNDWGLFDMHGNVCEWCIDSYKDELPGGRDAYVSDEGLERVLRGGGLGSAAEGCRSAHRARFNPSKRRCYTGFRVALSAIR